RTKLSASERWQIALDKVSGTNRRGYEREFEQFLEWADETPEGLLDYYLEHQDMSLIDYVKEYEESLTQRGYTGGKQATFVKAFKKFFAINGHRLIVDIPRKEGNQAARVAKAEEIEAALRFSIINPRDAAMIAIAKDSALRNSDIIRITFSDVQPALDNPELEFHGWQKLVHKTRAKKRQALPCLGPEALRYLRAWVFKMGEMGYSMEPEDFIFVGLRSAVEYSSVGVLRKAAVKGKGITTDNAGNAISDMFKRAGFDDLSANSLRKFNTTMLSLDGMPESLIKAMHGKHQQSSTDYYLKATAPQMLEVYKKHYASLTVDGQAELANQNKTLEEKNERLHNEITQSNILLKDVLDKLGLSPEELLGNNLS
ncbi:unnamed protein product, partial [marine sediment metagenome]